MMHVFDCEQGSPEWYACRAGIPTASMFATVMAKGKDGGASLTRAKYMRQLAGEVITGVPLPSYTNEHMERGKEMEQEARDAYTFLTDYEPQRVGFVRNGPKGCSPDSLIGSDGVLELKTKLADLAIECILKNDFPPAHKAQCQGALWIAEREWVDICVYWPSLPLFIKRAGREEGYIANLAGAVNKFNDELAAMVDQIRRYGALDKAA